MSAPPVTAAPAVAPPSDLAVALHPGVRVLDGGRVLVGGSPLRVMRLTAEGARTVSGWRRRAAVGAAPAHRRLARRLLDAGVLSPAPFDAASTRDLTFVVPVRDRPEQVGRCLRALREACAESPIVVVDDGSSDAASVRAACAPHGARLIRHATSRGPAAARNTGALACTTAHVGFVDADVVVPPGVAEGLLAHLADPCVGAVAPRVRSLLPAAGLVGGYETRHSALDMGPGGGLVAPGLPTSYVPSAALFVRRSALGGGFDESLTVGEDVDLVWRLARAGWSIRYVAGVEVWHEHRVRIGAFVARRRMYARSIGALARRHPDAVAAMWVSPAPAVPWILLLAGRRRAALVTAAAAFVRASRWLQRVPGPHRRLAAALVARGLLMTGVATAHATRRAWLPLVGLLALRRPGARALLLAAFATPVAQDALSARDVRAGLGDVPMRLLDEAVALAGTWEGCLRARTLRPVLPSWRPPA